MKWIKTRKKLPKPGKSVLCEDGIRNYFIGYIDRDGNWWIDVYDDENVKSPNEAEYWCEIKSPYSGIYHRILRAWRKMRRKK